MPFVKKKSLNMVWMNGYASGYPKRRACREMAPQTHNLCYTRTRITREFKMKS